MPVARRLDNTLPANSNVGLHKLWEIIRKQRSDLSGKHGTIAHPAHLHETPS